MFQADSFTCRCFLEPIQGTSTGPSDLKPVTWMIYSVPLLVCICLSCYHSTWTFTIWIPSLSFFLARPKSDLFLRALSCGIYLIHGNTPNSFILLNFGVERLPSWNHKMTLVYRVRVRQFHSNSCFSLIVWDVGRDFFSWRNVFTKPFSLFSDISLQS